MWRTGRSEADVLGTAGSLEMGRFDLDKLARKGKRGSLTHA
jgi:hypothetical protein